ncbi:hypothetical protein DN752_19720 [Echinicola strongylocentroti]|uniref:Leucine-rich repeat domain-containing protein n=1 Tax=Echinicola strongylocentroti TaxID=1795355 RepID=A0A2Z4INF6_9BACT|nr:hypothetical protein [Echinicola strongylocentroti]AWW32188.1 hypothetical protein DN752_19720 [Echinicola strongylocentroti]
MKLSAVSGYCWTWISKRFSHEVTEEMDYSIPQNLHNLSNDAGVIIRAKMLQKHALRLFYMIPEKHRSSNLARDVDQMSRILGSYLGAKAGSRSVFIKTPNSPYARLLPMNDYLEELKGKLPQLEQQLQALETSLLILKRSSFENYDTKWLQLSPFLMRSMLEAGRSPKCFLNTRHLRLKLEEAQSITNRLEGLHHFDQLTHLEVVGALDDPREFNELTVLPELQSLTIEKGPKIKWPEKRLSIKQFPNLQQLTIRQANRWEDYQLIFSLSRVERLTLMNFYPENLKDIINIRCLEQFKEINIHFTTSFQLSACTNPLIRNLIKHYQLYTAVHLFPAASPTNLP